MLHSTLNRLKGMDTNQIIIVTNDDHKFFVKSLVEETNSNAKLIIEPCGRNTAPAIAAAANIAEKDSMLLVLPADHLIESVDGFQEMVNNVQNSSCEKSIVIFGIKPKFPHTGYGYIKTSKIVDKPYLAVEKFVEKPDSDIAKKYIVDDKYYWNSGMFMFRNDLYLRELKDHNNKMYKTVKKSIPDNYMELYEIKLNKYVF